MQLLHIDSAITGSNSVSRQLTAQVVAAWTAAHPGTQVDYLDLVANAPAHFTMEAMAPRTGQTEGLAKGKTVIIVSSRGGVYSTSEGGRAMEHQESYLQTVLGFFGVTDVRFVRAEGVAMGGDAKAQALAAAAQAIEAHVKAHAANQDRVSQAA